MPDFYHTLKWDSLECGCHTSVNTFTVFHWTQMHSVKHRVTFTGLHVVSGAIYIYLVWQSKWHNSVRLAGLLMTNSRINLCGTIAHKPSVQIHALKRSVCRWYIFSSSLIEYIKVELTLKMFSLRKSYKVTV